MSKNNDTKLDNIFIAILTVLFIMFLPILIARVISEKDIFLYLLIVVLILIGITIIIYFLIYYKMQIKYLLFPFEVKRLINDKVAINTGFKTDEKDNTTIHKITIETNHNKTNVYNSNIKVDSIKTTLIKKYIQDGELKNSFTTDNPPTLFSYYLSFDWALDLYDFDCVAIDGYIAFLYKFSRLSEEEKNSDLSDLNEQVLLLMENAISNEAMEEFLPELKEMVSSDLYDLITKINDIDNENYNNEEYIKQLENFKDEIEKVIKEKASTAMKDIFFEHDIVPLLAKHNANENAIAIFNNYDKRLSICFDKESKQYSYIEETFVFNKNEKQNPDAPFIPGKWRLDNTNNYDTLNGLLSDILVEKIEKEYFTLSL